MINFRSIKTQLNLALTGFALYLFLKEPHFDFLTGFIWAVSFSILIEGIFLFIKNRKFQITESALTSGLIMGFLLASESAWWSRPTRDSSALGGRGDTDLARLARRVGEERGP